MEAILFISLLILVGYVWGLRRRAKEHESLSTKLTERVQALEAELVKSVKYKDSAWKDVVSRLHGLEWQVREVKERVQKISAVEGEPHPAPAAETEAPPIPAPPAHPVAESHAPITSEVKERPAELSAGPGKVPPSAPFKPAPLPANGFSQLHDALSPDAARTTEKPPAPSPVTTLPPAAPHVPKLPAPAPVPPPVTVVRGTPPSPPKSVTVPPPPTPVHVLQPPAATSAEVRVPTRPTAQKPPAHVPPPPIVPAAPVRASAPVVKKPRPAFNWEELLGANLFTKLGVILLVIGMTFLLMTQWYKFGPGVKVLLGFLAAAAMLVPGIYYEKRERWRILARAGIGGGWALTFFVTYAMYFIPASRVISERLDLFLMLIVASAMVAHTLKYRSQVVTGLAFFLAFTTVTISNVTAYSLLASAILAVALVCIVLKLGWYELEVFGILATFLNHYYWLRPIIARVGQHNRFEEYAASSALLIFYWLLFRTSFVIRRIDEDRQEKISIVAALVNVGLFLGIMGYQAVHPPHPFWFFFGVGAVELVFGQLPWTKHRRPAFILLTTLGAVLLITAFPYKYSGASLSMIWLVDAEAFFLAGVFLREVVFRRLGLLAGFLTAGQIVLFSTPQIIQQRNAAGADIALPKVAIVFLVAAVVFYLNAHFMTRRWKELTATAIDGIALRLGSYTATLLAALGIWAACSEHWTAVFWAALALGLAFSGRTFDDQDLSAQAHIIAAVAIGRAWLVNIIPTTAHTHLTWRLISVALVAALLYAASRWAGPRAEAGKRGLAAAYTWAASALVGLLIWYELKADYAAPAWVTLALVLALLGTWVKLREISYQAHAFALSATVGALLINLGDTQAHIHLGLRLGLVLGVVALLYVCARLAHTSGVPGAGSIAEAHTWAATLLGAVLVFYETSLQWAPVYWSGMALALVWLGARLKRRDLGFQSFVLFFTAFAWLLSVNLGTTGVGQHINLRLITVGVSIALMYLGSFPAAQLESARRLKIPEGLTWLGSTLVTLLAWYELRPIGVAVAWMVFGLILFELGFVRRSTSLRLQGYVALASSFARLFYVNLGAAGEPGQISPRVWTVIPIALAFFYVFWRTKGETDPSFDLDRRFRVSDYHCFFGAIAFAALMRAELDNQWVVAGWAGMIVLLLALARWLKLRIFLLQGLLLGVVLLARSILYNFMQPSYFSAGVWWYSRPAAIGVTVAMLLASLIFAFPLRSQTGGNEQEENRFRRAVSFLMRRPEQFFFFLPVMLLTVLIALDLRSGMVTLAWGGEAVAIFVLALAVGERSYRLIGLSMLLVCVGKIVIVDVWELHGTDRYLTLILMGIALLAVSTLYTRYREAIHRYL